MSIKEIKRYLEFGGIDLSDAKEIEVQSGSEKELSFFQWEIIEMKQCFKNSAQLCISSSKIEYCVGFAMSMIPMEHSWISIDGKYYDPTWEKFTNIGESYLLLKTFDNAQLLDFLELSQNYPPDIENMMRLGFLSAIQ